MAHTAQTEAPARPKLGVRTGSSRKLLERKAAELAMAAGEPAGESLEDSFPAADDGGKPHADDAAANVPACADGGVTAAETPQEPHASAPAVGRGNQPAACPDAAQEPAEAAPAQAAGQPAAALPTIALWSDEDERTFQALAARRQAAGRTSRGRHVGDQLVRLGTINPNQNTVVAVIVGIVAAAGGQVSRAELVTAMAAAAFPNSKARPADRGWCQGYIAGAARDGFLVLAEQPAAEPAADAA